MKTPELKLLVISDHFLYRHSLSEAILTFAKTKVTVQSAASLNEAQQMLNVFTFDVFMIRFDKTIKSPLQFIKYFKRRWPMIKLIILTFWDNEYYNQELIKSGADFYHLMDSNIQLLVEEIEKSKSTYKSN